MEFGLIGKTLGHSFSKGFFTEKFKNEGVDAEYLNFELPEISAIESVFNRPNLKGLNVTIPYKTEVIPFLDELSEEAQAIGAVNVIQFKNGKKIGHNSDAFGFKQSIKPFLTNKHERALILGTGGASKAVAYVFKQIGLDVAFITRSPKNNNEFSYSECNEHMLNAFKVIVNCTPIGTSPKTDECPDIPYQFITNEHFTIDLIYNPAQTLFLKKCADQGAVTLNGLSMLHEQALKAYSIWTEEV